MSFGNLLSNLGSLLNYTNVFGFGMKFERIIRLKSPHCYSNTCSALRKIVFRSIRCIIPPSTKIYSKNLTHARTKENAVGFLNQCDLISDTRRITYIKLPEVISLSQIAPRLKNLLQNITSLSFEVFFDIYFSNQKFNKKFNKKFNIYKYLLVTTSFFPDFILLENLIINLISFSY
jgi:hypothetical protein